MAVRKSLTDVELATLGVMRDLCDSAVRRGLADVGLRVRLWESTARLRDVLKEFDREAQS